MRHPVISGNNNAGMFNKFHRRERLLDGGAPPDERRVTLPDTPHAPEE
jgi:hypothetical protein